MKKTVGNIKLPILETIKFKGSDEEVLDVLFDLNIIDLSHYLKAMIKHDDLNKVKASPITCSTITASTNNGFIMLMYKANKYWNKDKKSDYTLFVAPTFIAMKKYFQGLSYRTMDDYARSNLEYIILKLDRHSTYRVSNMDYT